jgi:hypothetical protein
VICEPTRSKWWGTGRRSPRNQDPLIGVRCGKSHSQAQEGTGPGSAHLLPPLVLHPRSHPRPNQGAPATSSSTPPPASPSTKPGSARERAQAGSVPRIARGLEGKKIGLVIAVARAPRLRAMTFPSPIVPSWHKKRKKRGRFGVGAGLRGQIPDRPPILEGSVGPSKAPLAYRPTSFRPSRQGHGSISDRVPTPRGVERVGVTRDHLSTERLDAPYPWGLGRVVALPQPTKRGAPVRTLRYAREW